MYEPSFILKAEYEAECPTPGCAKMVLWHSASTNVSEGDVGRIKFDIDCTCVQEKRKFYG